MKDRFSLHVDDGQSEILEALTIMRNGFTRSQSGLVGITNITHTDSEAPIIPQTVFNVQSTGHSNIRFSSTSNHASKIQLLGNGNVRSSGLEIAYVPSSKQVDFSLLKPNGCEGDDLGFMKVASNGYIGIGTTKFNSYTNFTPNAPLTIWHSGDAKNSGTIALKENLLSPNASNGFGKIFVKSDSMLCGEDSASQGLFFLDDSGKEYNLTHPSGSIETDENQNTFAGILAPKVAFGCGSAPDTLNCNTVYGHAAGFHLISASNNTLIGCHAGSGISTGNNNTILGAYNLTNANAHNSIILGYDNLSPSNPADGQTSDAFFLRNIILIGSELSRNADVDAYTMLIGYGEDPVIEAGLGVSNSRYLSVKSTSTSSARISLESLNNRVDITDKEEVRGEGYNPLSVANVGIIEFRDSVSSLQHKGMASLRFSNQFGHSQTLVDFVPSGKVPNSDPSFTLPSEPTPYVSISGDLLLNGCIRFADQSTLCGALDYNLFGDSGIDKRVEATRSTFVLDYTNLDLASSITPAISASNSYFSLEVPSGTSRKMGKISIEALASYVSSGYAAVEENCNHVWSDIDSESRIDVVNNSGSVFIGCEVAVESTGWRNAVFIGPQAGAYSTVPNTSLATDTAPVFIGYRAGYDTDDLDNTIAIGTSAGENADQSADSIFIGSSAGHNASGNRNSIGIGENALNGLDTPGHDSLGGNRNIEIVTGLDNDSRLLYSSGHLNDKLNIQNTIGGDTAKKFVSLGDATISPSHPVESRRDKIYSDHASTEFIHAFINNGVKVASVDSSGDFRARHEFAGGAEAWFGTYEGFVTEGIGRPTSYALPTSGKMRIQSQRNNFGTDGIIWVTNRDPKLDIHGPGSDGGPAFIVTNRVNGENRPVYISCSGDGS